MPDRRNKALDAVANAMLAEMIPAFKAAILKHLAPEARPLRMPVVLSGDDEIADDMTRALARKILDKHGLASRRKR